MTKKELSINITWDEFEMGTCRIFVETLNQYIPAVFFQDNKPKPTVTDKMLQGVNNILDMNSEEFSRLEEIIGTETYKIKELHFDQDNDVYEGVYSEVILNTGTNQQVGIVVKDGKFIGVNDGTYFDTLEVSEKKSEDYQPSDEQRKKLIDMMMSS